MSTSKLKLEHARMALVSLAVVCGVGVGRAEAQPLIRNVTPAQWLADPVPWIGDVSPRNKIQDTIDETAAGEFEIVVNYRRCVGSQDLAFLDNLSATSHVQSRSPYITSVAVGGATYSDVQAIAALEEVAFIEEQDEFMPTLVVSVPAMCVTAGAHPCAGNVEDAFGLTGAGVTVAIVDSGVDNGHDAFASTPFIGGYNAVSGALTDPDDPGRHGTHTASIVLGQATATTGRGVAPGAGLVDIRVADDAGHYRWEYVERAVRKVYEMRNQWDVDVLLLPVAQFDRNFNPKRSDGLDSLSQLVDLAPAMGIVVVAPVGNYATMGNIIASPGAATHAITVAAINTRNSVDRPDDVIAAFSSRGPRTDDGDHDLIDELKPDVSAPGAHGGCAPCPPPPPCNQSDGIVAARSNTQSGSDGICGTSRSAAHVAGLVALILEARPDLDPASVKDLVIRTAEPRLPVTFPTVHPSWNEAYGFGIVNAFDAIVEAMGGVADITFDPAPPSAPGWLSRAIQVEPPAQANVLSVITAVVANEGPSPVNGVRVNFGIHDFSASAYAFHDVGTRIVDLPVGVTPVTLDWTPQDPGHKCVQIELAGSTDTDLSNNRAQRNLDVAQSPVAFKVQNTLTESAAVIEFTWEFAEVTNPPWGVQISPSSVTLAADDCPADVEVLLIPPPSGPAGFKQTVHVAARIGGELLGGVSVEDTSPVSESVPAMSQLGALLTFALLVLAGAVILVRGRTDGTLRGAQSEGRR